jgi:capsule polysaccharide modification protein KpsS
MAASAGKGGAAFTATQCIRIGAKDLSWVTNEDIVRLHRVRSELQKKHSLERGDHVLAALQIENDTQILCFSRYRGTEEFVADVEALYPSSEIIARPHPKSHTLRSFARAKC